MSSWCPKCRCCAGEHYYTGRHNKNHPVYRHYRCLNCGHGFTKDLEKE
jgi:hypothetical protein